MLNGDHLLAVREEVARSYQEDGLSQIAAAVAAGRFDDGNRMRAALAAVERVLKGLFE